MYLTSECECIYVHIHVYVNEVQYLVEFWLLCVSVEFSLEV